MKLPPIHDTPSHRSHVPHGRRPDEGFPGFVVPVFDREPYNTANRIGCEGRFVSSTVYYILLFETANEKWFRQAQSRTRLDRTKEQNRELDESFKVSVKSHTRAVFYKAQSVLEF